LRPAESSFVDKIREFFLHHVVNDFDCLVETFLGSTSHMKVKRGFLSLLALDYVNERTEQSPTAAVAMFLSG
jgi:hypothetical protein